MKLFVLALLALLSTYAKALTVEPEFIEHALQSADFVGDIEIQSVEPLADRNERGIRSIATANVLSSSGGETVVKFQFWGGETGERGYFFSGFARPYVGRRYHAYLKKISTDLYEIAGFEFGLRDLSPTRGFSRNKTDGSNNDGSGSFLYWDPTYFPIPYYISEPTFRSRSELITEIDQSYKTWRDIERIPVEFMAMGCSSGRFNENDGLNSVIYITKDWPFDSAAIAITRNFYVAGTSEHSGLILDSDILLNGVDHQFSIGAESGKHDIRNIVTHEVGHFLGMGHEIAPISTDSTMYAVASTSELKKRSLSANDIAGVEAAYQGVGQKLSGQHSFCKAAEQNTGCRLGIKRGRSGFPLGFVLGWVIVLLQIPLARILLKTKLTG